MTNSQLHPLKVNPITGEVYLSLRAHKNIIITPARREDASALVRILNDPAVYDWLLGPPFPYTADDAKDWLDKCLASTAVVLKQLEDASDQPEPITVGRCPVHIIREVKEDGSDVFIGDLSLIRCSHGELMGPNGVDWENKAKFENMNNSLPVGDPTIIWSMGDYLAPSHHGQGIMTDAVGTVLHEWGIPRMNIRHMWCSAFTGNVGSVKVFLGNGFKVIKTFEEHFEVKGKMRGLHLMEWRYDNS